MVAAQPPAAPSTPARLSLDQPILDPLLAPRLSRSSSLASLAPSSAAPSDQDQHTRPPLCHSPVQVASVRPLVPGTVSSSSKPPSSLSTPCPTSPVGLPCEESPKSLTAPHSEGTACTHLSPAGILRNPLHVRRTLPVSFTHQDADGHVRTLIRAVTSQPDPETALRRQQQAERARRRELKAEARQREKEALRLWGLGKFAMILGRADINFNSQMAILGGWGTGSGSTTYIPALGKKVEAEREVRKSLLAERKQIALRRARNRAPTAPSHSGRRLHRWKTHPLPESDSDEEAEANEDGWLNADELAAMNAIINTRRSMASAQALADGLVRPRAQSVDTTRTSNPPSSAQDDSSNVHFAPLPVPWVDEERSYFSAMLGTLRRDRDDRRDSLPTSHSPQASLEEIQEGKDVTAFDKADTESVTEPVARHHNRLAAWRIKHSNRFRRHHSDTSMLPSKPLLRLRRTHTPGVLETFRAQSDASQMDPPRRKPSWHSIKRTNTDPPRRRELDPAERQRRRDLVLAARPGGTGMVTLLDGTRIPARRVTDPDAPHALEGEWGHALLAKQRPSSAPDPTPSAEARVDSQVIMRRHEAEVATLGAEVIARVYQMRAKRRVGEDESSSEEEESAEPTEEEEDEQELHPRATTRAAAQERFHHHRLGGVSTVDVPRPSSDLHESDHTT